MDILNKLYTRESTFGIAVGIKIVDRPVIKINRPTYEAEREFFREIERDQTTFIDKTVLSLAGGALGLSLTFLHDFAPHPLRQSLWALITAWAMLIGSILLVLVGLHCSQWAIGKHVDLLDKLASENKPAQVTFRNRWAIVTNATNFLATVTLIAGIVLLAAFSYENMSTDASTVEKEKAAVSPLQMQDDDSFRKGYVPRPPPVPEPPPEPVQENPPPPPPANDK